MENPFKLLYLGVLERLKTEVPELKYIDRNLAQYQNEDFRNSSIFPSALIKFSNTDFSELSDLVQLADRCVVDVTLFFENWNATSNITPDLITQAGLSYLDIEQKVYAVLHGWSPDGFTPLIRINQKDQSDNDLGLNATGLLFTTSFEDYSLESSAPTPLSIRSE